MPGASSSGTGTPVCCSGGVTPGYFAVLVARRAPVVHIARCDVHPGRCPVQLSRTGMASLVWSPSTGDDRGHRRPAAGPVPPARGHRDRRPDRRDAPLRLLAAAPLGACGPPGRDRRRLLLPGERHRTLLRLESVTTLRRMAAAERRLAPACSGGGRDDDRRGDRGHLLAVRRTAVPVARRRRLPALLPDHALGSAPVFRPSSGAATPGSGSVSTSRSSHSRAQHSLPT